jgi:hypothetical protein
MEDKNKEIQSIEVKIARLDEKVSFVLTELKEIRDGTFSDIASLKRDKADRKELESLQKLVNDDIETRMERLEGRNNWYGGALAVIALCGLLIGYIYFIQQEAQDKQIDLITANQQLK